MNNIQRAIDWIEKYTKPNCETCSHINTEECDRDYCACEADALKIAISAMQELQQYRQIGTPEECRTAMEKRQAMKVTDIHVDEYYCPVCGAENCCDQGMVGDKYCPECGQALIHEGR